MCDKDTNKPKGYGFADYMDANLMDAAVRLLNGRDVHGRPIRVDFADHSDRERIRGVSPLVHTSRARRRRGAFHVLESASCERHQLRALQRRGHPSDGWKPAALPTVARALTPTHAPFPTSQGRPAPTRSR